MLGDGYAKEEEPPESGWIDLLVERQLMLLNLFKGPAMGAPGPIQFDSFLHAISQSPASTRSQKECPKVLKNVGFRALHVPLG